MWLPKRVFERQCKYDKFGATQETMVGILQSYWWIRYCIKWNGMLLKTQNHTSPSLADQDWKGLNAQSFHMKSCCFKQRCWLRGGQGWIRAPYFLFYMCGTAIHITHWVCKESVPFLRTDKIGYFRASNVRRHALGMLSWAGSSQRPCERRTYNQ